MFLKRITLAGFKSFSDRVDFEFGRGVTGIVGPNGCGKSNIVDAFKWVLGEQSARSLRGRQMTDMIFNGSSSRRSSSVAQVDLVFDNTDQTLSIDHDEVTVSRKLYRSGESEYLLNQQAARLKDIRELFMDTGVGVDAYSVIEQGKVDGLLQSSPVERRVIFDEAAGISKYKSRRRDAERKLERSEQNLLRVADIIEELEKRLRSVKLQAAKARNYKQYEARLAELRSMFAMGEYHRFTGEREQFERQVGVSHDEVTRLRTDIGRCEMESVQTTERLDRLAEDISVADLHLSQWKSEQAAQTERIAAARKRVEEQTSLLERSETHRVADAKRIEETRRELDQVDASEDSLQRQLRDLQERIDALAERERLLAGDLTKARAILEDEKSGIIDLVRRSARTHNEIIRLNTHRESLVGQKGRLSERDARIRSELEDTLQQKAELSQRRREVEALIAEESRTLEEKKAQAERIRAERKQCSEQLSAMKERRSALQSRREVLEELERNMEGVGAAVRKLLDEKQLRGECEELSWIIGLVADVFETDVTHARMIESALGEWDQYVVVSDSKRLLAHMRAEQPWAGRLTALCLDRLPPIVNERDFSGQEGFVARAIDLVRFAEPLEQVAHHLLGKTVVVETLDAALALASEDVTGHRFVTLGGEVVEADGRIRFGPPSSTAGLISRKSELRDIDIQMAVIAERIGSLSDQRGAADAELGHLDAVQQELRTAIYESNTARIEAESALTRIAETVRRLTDEQPLIAQEALLIEQQINEVLQESEKGGRSLEALERENQERERKIESHQHGIDEMAAGSEQIQEQLTEARVQAGQLNEKRHAARDRRVALQRAIGELEESLAHTTRDREQCCERIADARASIQSGLEKQTALAERIAQEEATAVRLRQDRDALRLEVDALSHAIKNARSELTTAEAGLHERQMSLAEITVRRDELVSRVQEELGIDLSEKYKAYEPAEENWEEVEEEIATLRAKMNRLGNVNLGAIEELEELEQRHGFLTGQRDDLVESRRQLEQLITRLNAESRDRFQEAFQLIRDHFRTLFRKLFGGGRADVILEDPDNVLESGIEIVAQPPGKELQSISLMSGGEKSMTAIALLMSIFKTRPAPFAIMDEVDAALDEANNDRFNRIIQEFVSASQFILITHSKWSMSIADRLYGITMQEPGVSTRVSVELASAHVA